MADDSKYDSEVEPLGGTRSESRNKLRAVDVDSSHRLMVNVGGLGSPAQAGEAASAAASVVGEKIVARGRTTGTGKLQLQASSVPCRRILFQPVRNADASPNNTSVVSIDDTNVTAANGAKLAPTDPGIVLPFTDVNLAYIYTSTAGDGVDWVAIGEA